jgi:YYY domain-containing protein
MEWISIITTWWLMLFALGLIFFPLANKLFGNFIDSGYAFSKTIAIIVLSYIALVSGILKILPFSKEALILTVALSAFLISKILKKQIREIFKIKKTTLIVIVLTEVIFLFSLLFLAFIRGQEPSIRGLEKFMDFGFMQAINKSVYFPPLDMWYGPDDLKPDGYPINYYYFGHLTGALLVKLHGVLPSIGYNLVLATIFAQGVTLGFSLISTIVHSLRSLVVKNKRLKILPSIFLGLLGTYILNLGGNLHTIYLFTKGYKNDEPVPFWTIFQSLDSIFTTMTTMNKSLLDALISNSSYWYPNATRFIPFTIHEFPSYSYVVADLHGHVFDIPFVLLLLALIFVFFTRKNPALSESKNFYQSLKNLWTYFLKNKERTFKKWLATLFSMISRETSLKIGELAFAAIFGFLISINYMTNAFDGPIYLLFIIVLFLFKYHLSLAFITLTTTTLISFIASSLPFSIFFEPFASSIGVNCAPAFLTDIKSLGPFLFEKGNCQLSPLYMLFLLWGFFIISFILLLITNYIKRLKTPNSFSIYDKFAFLLFGYGIFLIIVPEILYAKDIYPGHFRANTMFKMGYQAFIMMSIASTIAIYRVFKTTVRPYRVVLKTLMIVPLLLVVIYPYLSFPSYYPGLLNGAAFTKQPQLDGAQWMIENDLKAQYEILNYLNNRLENQPIILEAQGDSYTDFNVISAYTGYPTVAGWWVHQWLWRGSADVVGRRIPDITAIYTSDDLSLTRELIKKYQIEYVIITNQEREKYENIQEDKFSQIGVKIFQSSDSFGALYKVY